MVTIGSSKPSNEKNGSTSYYGDAIIKSHNPNQKKKGFYEAPEQKKDGRVKKPFSED